MASISSTVICTHCRQEVSLNNVRYAQNGRDLICIPCFQNIPSEKSKVAVDREKYHCMRCNYKFSLAKDSRLRRRCPYCASENIALPEIITANTVLSAVTARPEITYPR